MQKKKILGITLSTLFITILLVTGYSLAANRVNSYPSILIPPANFAQNLQVKSSGETVTIIRDIYGVPHINASTQQGVFFGHGYVQAEDGIELLMLNILTATGRLSKTFGPYEYNNTWYPGYKFRVQGLAAALGIDNSMSDGLLRMLKIPVSSTDYPKINETMRLIMIEPFAAGVNYYIYTHWDSIPSWVKENVPVRGEDIASMGALINLLFSNQVLQDWMKAEAEIKRIGVIEYLNTYQNASGPHTLCKNP